MGLPPLDSARKSKWEYTHVGLKEKTSFGDLQSFSWPLTLNGIGKNPNQGHLTWPNSNMERELERVFKKKCLQAFIAPQSQNFAFLTFKLRLHPLPKVVDAHGHHRWIQREKMNKVLSYLKQKRLNSIGDMFLGSSSAPKGRTARRHLSPLSAWRDGRTDMCFLAHGCVVLLIGI